MKTRCPVHPGRLIEEYMDQAMSVTALADHLKITRANLSRVINGRGGVSAELALRLSEAFGTTPQVWLNMQANYDLWHARENRAIKPVPLLVHREAQGVG